MSPRWAVAPLDGGHFERLFWTDNLSRDNFRSRLFGMFSEEIVRVWARNDAAPYDYVGRPTLWRGRQYFTIDHALRRKVDGKVFVAEQKAELAWAAYSQLRLVSARQVASHVGKPTFDWFLDLARSSESSIVKVSGRPVAIDGVVLVWGAITPIGRTEAIEQYGFENVLSLEAMLADLRDWEDPAWAARIVELRDWSGGLLAGLLEAGT
jgi:hypothetical protein